MVLGMIVGMLFVLIPGLILTGMLLDAADPDDTRNWMPSPDPKPSEGPASGEVSSDTWADLDKNR
jgi:hypothetical protein